MVEYIEREALIADLLSKDFYPAVARRCIEKAPAADVAPVVHGRWVFNAGTVYTLSCVKCSCCGWWTIDPSVSDVYSYCPSCGAKMDLEAE